MNYCVICTCGRQLEDQVNNEIEEIKDSVSYDKVVVDKETIWWKDIVAIYAVIASNRDGIDVANMDDRAFNKLKEIFDEVVDVDYETSTYYVTHVYTVNGEQVKHLIIWLECIAFQIAKEIKHFYY